MEDGAVEVASILGPQYLNTGRRCRDERFVAFHESDRLGFLV